MDNKAGVTPPNDANILSIIENYYKVMNTKVQGRFMFQSVIPNNEANVKKSVLIGGNFYDVETQVRSHGGTVYIGNNKLEPHTDGTYGFDSILPREGLYGTDVTFSIIPPSYKPVLASTNGIDPGIGNPTGPPVSTTIYSPTPISITNAPPRTPITFNANTSLPITWNADPNNPNGVVIIAQYIPERGINQSLMAAGYNHLLTSSELVTDNGSTTIPWSFFTSFPAGGHMVLWIARGNYTILANGSYNYQVGGYSTAAIWDLSIPFAPPAINGGSSYYFSTSQTYGAGTITASPGTIVTVTVYGSGSGGGFSTNLSITGASFVTNSSGQGSYAIAANNNTQTATFVMPASGSVSWWGRYTAPNSYGSGGISVH